MPRGVDDTGGPEQHRPVLAGRGEDRKKEDGPTTQVARMYPVRWMVSVVPSAYVIFTSGLKVPVLG